jgi:predicted methyltransferase
MMRLMMSLAAAAIVALGSGPASAQQSSYTIPSATPEHIRRAVESDARTAEERARDAGRKPAEVMTLAEIEPGDRVIELAAFGHYYTTMLVEAVGPDGRVDMFDMPWTERFGGEGARAFDAEHANATYQQVHYNEATFPEDVDAVLNVLFYHDLVQGDVNTANLNAKLLAALKPGGIYLIVDHKAEDGSGWRDAESLHRMGAETIIEEVTAAGFELVQESDLLAVPSDPRTQQIFTPELRGNTDRAVLVFRKPDA